MDKPSVRRASVLVLSVFVPIGAAITSFSVSSNASWVRHADALGGARGQGSSVAPIAVNGGSLRATTEGLVAVLGYSESDAAPGTLLALRGTMSAVGAPRFPSGHPVLFLEIEVSGTHVVTFGDHASLAALQSPLLRGGTDYSVILFARGRPVGFPYDAGIARANGTLRFRSPLADVSLAPGVPLTVEIVAGARLQEAAPRVQSTSMVHAGSTVSLSDSEAFAASLDYPENDARTGTTLSLMYSGSWNLTNATTPAGGAALFLQIWLDGVRPVHFGQVIRDVLHMPGGLPSVVIRSPVLTPGVAYEGYIFAGGSLISASRPTVASFDGTLLLRSPLVGITLAPHTPTVLEVVAVAGRSIRTAAGPAAPHPSPMHRGTAAPWDVEDGVAFYLPPPGVNPVNKIRQSHFRHARKSYAWRHRDGRHRVLFQFATAIQHVVVIVMENRTPDDLFSGYWGIQDPSTGTTFGTALDLANPTGSPTLTPDPLEYGLDPIHRHDAFYQETLGHPLAGMCLPPNSPSCNTSVFAYVPLTSTNPPNSEVQNYIDLIEEWGYASHVMQSNQGPSFPAHQYLISGQSGGLVNWPTSAPPTIEPNGMSENPKNNGGQGDPDPSDPDPDANGGGGSCFKGYSPSPTKYVPTTNMTQAYPDLPETSNTPLYTCNDYLTIFDEMQTAFGTPYYQDWQYIAASYTTIWSGPMAVKHLAANAMATPLVTQPFAADPDALNWIADISLSSPSPRPFANLTYITECQHESDHPGGGGYARGPEELANLVNAIGEHQWYNTIIIVTWDDWGGWYDHYTPPPFPVVPTPNAYHNPQDPNEWGYRVPLIVVSAYVKKHGIISAKVRSQGAILNLIEDVFSLGSGPGSLGTDDGANLNSDGTPDVLGDLINFADATPGPTFSPLPTNTFTPAPGACPGGT